MSIERIYILSVIVGIFFLAFGSADSAYATTTTLDVANTGMACESLGGDWTTPPPTCTLSTTLAIPVGDTLIVSNGVTLAFLPNKNLINQGEITNFGTITITGTTSNNGLISNRDTAEFTNSGTITITGTSGNRGILRNIDTAEFTNSGTITLTGTSGNSGQLRNLNDAEFTNSGTITLTGTSGNSGQLRNLNDAEFTNSGTITITGTSGNSGLVVNLSDLTNSGSLTTNNGFNNNNANSIITNSGSIQITLVLDNTSGLIVNNCGKITFGSISGNLIQEKSICEFGKSNAYEDATIGKSHSGKQVVENGICIDIRFPDILPKVIFPQLLTIKPLVLSRTSVI